MEFLSSQTKRSRTPRACNVCRAKKIKCDGIVPCQSCTRRNTICVYDTTDKTTNLAQRRTSALDSSARHTGPRSATSSTVSTDLAPTEAVAHYTRGHQTSKTGGCVNNDCRTDPFNRSDSGQFGDTLDTTVYTKNADFHGSSSSASFLNLVERDHEGSISSMREEQKSLVSCLYNTATDPDNAGHSSLQTLRENTEDYFPEAAKRFVQGYFDGLHYAQPFLNKVEFLQGCQELWQYGRSSCNQSFLALYYAVLSFGSLVMVWRDKELIGGQNRFEWSRMLLDKALGLSGVLCQTTDLEAVQYFLFLAKIFQNELRLHVAYIYVGLAVRIALAMGLNRDREKKVISHKNEIDRAQTRTWWAAYSLEIELSFALGRPDSLGADVYHNRPFPQIDKMASSDAAEEATEGPEVEIIEILVRLARIIRDLPTSLYNHSDETFSKLQHIQKTDYRLGLWLAEIPQSIRPSRTYKLAGLLHLGKQSPYIKKQRLVLGTKYHNVRMLLHASLIGTAYTQGSDESMRACVDSAKSTIDLVYENYYHHDFFRTWWFNSAYTIFASTVILFFVDQNREEADRAACQELLQKAVEILNVMSENTVARKAAGIIQGCLDRLGERPDPDFTNAGDETLADTDTILMMSFWN